MLTAKKDWCRRNIIRKGLVRVPFLYYICVFHLITNSLFAAVGVGTASWCQNTLDDGPWPRNKNVLYFFETPSGVCNNSSIIFSTQISSN